MKKLKLIECPRDAMQGIHQFIPTSTKVEYLNRLLRVGFDTLDFGSFVSPKSVPQMSDTKQVLEKLDLSGDTNLLAIVANERGIREAAGFEQIRYLGFPFSISETFQQRNTNSSIKASLKTVELLVQLCSANNKEAVVYLSMAFGNPYEELWNLDIIHHWMKELVERGTRILSLSDTTGMASPENISRVYSSLIAIYPNTELGLHLHSNPENVEQVIEASYSSGCRRFDSALRGYGGCPMADDVLTGNLPTEKLVDYLEKKNEELDLNKHALRDALQFSQQVFGAI